MKIFRWRQRKETDLDAEISSHLDEAIRVRIERGESPVDARSNALREFGNVGLVKEVTRETWGWASLERLWQDLRFGWRMLLKHKGFMAVAILSLALGIGANTSIFSVVNAVLLKPLPYAEPQRLAQVTEVTPNGYEVVLSPDYIEWQRQSQAFEHLAAYGYGALNLTGRGEPERLECGVITANFFQTLGVAPQLGRVFKPEEDQPNGPRVVILSHGLWQRRFGGDPSLVGQSLILEGESHLVIGVAPPGFQFSRTAEIWLPLGLNVQEELRRQRVSVVEVIGRLKPGVSTEQARADVNVILRRIEQAVPKRLPGFQARVTLLSENLTGDLRQGLLALFGAVGLVLLIACANVAHLLLARTTLRRKELTIRAAVGAGRWRLVRQMLTESLLLAICGGVVGLALAMLGVKALVSFSPDDLVIIRDSGVDGAALLFTFIVSLFTGIAAGLIPAWQSSRADLTETLKENARKAVFARPGGGWRVTPALAAAELALTLVLLVGAGLVVKSFWRLRAVEPGYNPRQLLTMMLQLDGAKYPPGAQQQNFYRELLARLQAVPGVESAAIANSLPLTGRAGHAPLTIEGRPPAPDSQKPMVEVSAISLDYFRTMGMQIRAGRSFAPEDNESAPPVVVINETLARQHFTGEDPTGKRILYGFPKPSPLTIVGVVSDVCGSVWKRKLHRNSISRINSQGLFWD